MDWNKLWNDIVSFFENNIWNIVIFFAVLIGGIIIIKIFLAIIKKILYKTRIEKIALGFVLAILKVALYLCLMLALLSIIGIQITGVITALSAVLLAVGLALQGIIANAANGFVVVSSKMFKKGDYIYADGYEGKVSHINFLYTTIITADNKRVTIPNSTILNNSVVDYDTCLTRRVDFKFGVAYESDVEKVKKILVDCMTSNGKVLLEPAPVCRLNKLDASSIEFVARCWCDSEDYWDVYFDVLELAYNELKRNKISIPYNQIEIRERKDHPVLPVTKGGIPKRVEKERVVKENFEAKLNNILSNKKRKLKNKKNMVQNGSENKTVEQKNPSTNSENSKNEKKSNQNAFTLNNKKINKTKKSTKQISSPVEGKLSVAKKQKTNSVKNKK